MAVQALLQALLVKEVTDKADAAAHHEQRVQRARLDVLLHTTHAPTKTCTFSSCVRIAWTQKADQRTSASSRLNPPHVRIRSTKATPMAPSTLRIKLSFFAVVT